MKKLIATILTAAFLIAIVVTPYYKGNSTTLNTGANVYSNKNITSNVTTQ